MSSTANTLKPAKIDIDPNGDSATKLWKHWKKTFDNFIDQLEEERTEANPALNKLRLLTNFTSADLSEFVEDCNNFDSAINTIEDLFDKTPSEIFACHQLATRKQQPGETLSEFFQALQIISKNCQYREVTGEQHRQALCRDAFINGLTSAAIRQRLLQNVGLAICIRSSECSRHGSQERVTCFVIY